MFKSENEWRGIRVDKMDEVPVSDLFIEVRDGSRCKIKLERRVEDDWESWVTCGESEVCLFRSKGDYILIDCFCFE